MTNRWAWIPLVTLLAGACDGCKAPGPRQLVCEPIAYYEVLNPEQGASKAPFSIERLGPELESEQIRGKPDILWFPRKDRVRITWDMGGDFIPTANFIYSPGEGLARNVRYPKKVFPMKLFSDSKPERVRFGFRSEVCRKPREDGGYRNCTRTDNELFLVADMTCTWELYDPDGEIE